MLDDEGVERLDVGVESEIFLRRDVLGPRRTLGEAFAGEIVVSPDELLAGGLRRDLLSLLAGLVEFLPGSKHLPEGILTDDWLPVDCVENRLAPKRNNIVPEVRCEQVSPGTRFALTV